MRPSGPLRPKIHQRSKTWHLDFCILSRQKITKKKNVSNALSPILDHSESVYKTFVEFISPNRATRFSTTHKQVYLGSYFDRKSTSNRSIDKSKTRSGSITTDDVENASSKSSIVRAPLGGQCKITILESKILCALLNTIRQGLTVINHIHITLIQKELVFLACLTKSGKFWPKYYSVYVFRLLQKHFYISSNKSPVLCGNWVFRVGVL